MSIALTINGVTYQYPQVDDVDWGPDATDWAAAVTTGMLQKAGGLFQLLAEVDFGTAYGVKSLYFKTRATNPASAGQVRLGRTDVIAWRNEANSADLNLGVSSSNVLQFNGSNLQGEITVSDTTTIDLTLSSNVLSAAIVAGSIVNADISNSAAIAYSKLALTGSIVNADLANMAQSTFKGRAASSGTGAPVDLTATQATAILNDFVGDSGSGGTKGLVPAPSAGDAASNKFLSAGGSWAVPPGSGDVVGPASSLNGQIARFGDTSGKLLTATPATISNSDVDASAAIAYSKLNLSASIVNADVSNSAAIAYSKLSLSNSILNADINASAAIALSKLAALTASRALVSDVSGVVSVATTTATEIGYVNGVTSAIQTQIDGKMANPMTTGGDLIYGGASGAPTRLANGTAGQVLASAGGTSAPVWSTAVVNVIARIASGVSSDPTTPIVYGTEVLDTHNAYNATTGVFTAPVTGVYAVATSIALASGAQNLSVYVNGSEVAILGTPSATEFTGGTAIVSVSSGQTLDLRLDGSATTLGTTTQQLSIWKVG